MKSIIVRLLNLLFGIALSALGVVTTLRANIGYAPWEVFHVGIAKTTGMTIGVASIIVGIVIVVIVTVLGETLGLGTLASMVLTGVFIDLIIFFDFIPMAGNFAIGLVMLVAGLFTLAFGSYFYIRSAFGVGPRDNLMVILARKTKLPVGACRGIVEGSATFVGWLMGGMAGIGTILAFIAISFCVQIVFSAFRFDVTAIKHETLTDTFRLKR